MSEAGQDVINDYFTRNSLVWEKFYEDEGIQGKIHQERLRLAIAMVDRIESATRALDAGCGAGLATVEMARRGISVDAIDPVSAMVEATKRRAIANGVSAKVSAQIGDVQALPFPDKSFEIVIALGVLPWLPDMRQSLSEMVRVLKPGGYLIASMDMRLQIREFIDPMMNYYLRIPRRLLRNTFALCGIVNQRSDIRHYPVSRSAVHMSLRSAGLDKLDGRSIGYGPFTFLRREIVPNVLGAAIQKYLQSRANRDTPLIRSLGSQYLVLAQKRVNP